MVAQALGKSFHAHERVLFPFARERVCELPPITGEFRQFSRATGKQSFVPIPFIIYLLLHGNKRTLKERRAGQNTRRTEPKVGDETVNPRKNFVREFE